MRLEAVPRVHRRSVPCPGKAQGSQGVLYLGAGSCRRGSAMLLLHLSLLPFVLNCHILLVLGRWVSRDRQWATCSGNDVCFSSSSRKQSRNRLRVFGKCPPCPARCRAACPPPSNGAAKRGLRVHTTCLLQGRVPSDQLVLEGFPLGHRCHSLKDLTLSRWDPKAPA